MQNMTHSSPEVPAYLCLILPKSLTSELCSGIFFMSSQSFSVRAGGRDNDRGRVKDKGEGEGERLVQKMGSISKGRLRNTGQ